MVPHVILVAASLPGIEYKTFLPKGTLFVLKLFHHILDTYLHTCVHTCVHIQSHISQECKDYYSKQFCIYTLCLLVHSFQ